MTRNIDIYKRYGFKIDKEDRLSHATVVYMSMRL